MCVVVQLNAHDSRYVYAVLPRDAMLAQYILSLCVRPSVRPSQAGIVGLSKRLDESIWFLEWMLYSNLWTEKISPL